MKNSNENKRELVKKDYDAIADLYIEHCDNNDIVLPFIDRFINSLNGKSVLDVGCGSGKIANYFFSKGLHSKGVDFSIEMIMRARSRYPQVDFVCEDICNYHPQEKFDGIFSKYLLFHLPPEDIKSTLLNFYNMMKEDGKLCVIIDIPKVKGEQVLIEEFDNSQKIYYNYITIDELETALKQAQFKIEDKIILENNDISAEYAYGIVVVYASK